MYDFIFDESVSSTLAYTSQPYVEGMAVCLSVSYIPCATYSKKQTGDIITLSQFSEVNLWSETCDDAESGDKSDDNSNMQPLLSEEDMDAMSSVNESEDEPMSMEILEDILYSSQSHLSVNSREGCYKIYDRIKQI